MYRIYSRISRIEKNVAKIVQNCPKFENSKTIFLCKEGPETHIKRFWYILGDIFCDPCISRIDKLLANFFPKFLDLYASIYGS